MNKKLGVLLVIVSLFFSSFTFAEYQLKETEVLSLERMASSIKAKGKDYTKKVRAYLQKLDALLADPVVIKVIDDKRCVDCNTSLMLNELKGLSYLSDAEFIEQDFSDVGISKYLQENGIKSLPIFVFSTSELNDNGEISKYFVPLTDGSYMLSSGSSFDPFIKRSDKNFLIVDSQKYAYIKDISYTKGDANADITVLEYSDLECPFCAKLHTAGTIKDIEKEYGNKVNFIFNHFPLDFHKSALLGAKVLECLGKETSSKSFYDFIEIVFSEGNLEQGFLISEAVKLGAKRENIEICITDEFIEERINTQKDMGASLFGISGTPTSIIINNKTGEYDMVSGAFPYETFEERIDSLLR